MSVRYEGAAARFTTLEVARPGTRIGEDVLSDTEHALVLNYDEVFYLTGTKQELVNLLLSAIAFVTNAPDKPLVTEEVEAGVLNVGDKITFGGEWMTVTLHEVTKSWVFIEDEFGTHYTLGRDELVLRLVSE